MYASFTPRAFVFCASDPAHTANLEIWSGFKDEWKAKQTKDKQGYTSFSMLKSGNSRGARSDAVARDIYMVSAKR